MERLAQRIRQRSLGVLPAPENALAAMASDLAIQRELQLLAAEFAGDDVDGLGVE